MTLKNLISKYRSPTSFGDKNAFSPPPPIQNKVHYCEFTLIIAVQTHRPNYRRDYNFFYRFIFYCCPILLKEGFRPVKKLLRHLRLDETHVLLFLNKTKQIT